MGGTGEGKGQAKIFLRGLNQKFVETWKLGKYN